MNKPEYNPKRAQELQEFLSNCSPLELRWLTKASEKALEARVKEREREWKDASEARWAHDLQWTADGRLVDHAPICRSERDAAELRWLLGDLTNDNEAINQEKTA